MGRVDRAVRRARRHLQTDEALLGTVLGSLRANDGKRSRPVLLVATDRRVLLVPTRGANEPRSIALREVDAFAVGKDRLRLAAGEDVIELGSVEDRTALAMVGDLVGTRLSRLGDGVPQQIPPKVRIVPN
ncbi:MAG: hypothetical protein KY469_15825 [Actinobacteria bacterium]|nr:hypothetical protein [Actinomycetota bacterium]